MEHFFGVFRLDNSVLGIFWYYKMFTAFGILLNVSLMTFSLAGNVNNIICDSPIQICCNILDVRWNWLVDDGHKKFLENIIRLGLVFNVKMNYSANFIAISIKDFRS